MTDMDRPIFEEADFGPDPPAFSVLSIGDLVADVVLAVPRLPVQAGENQILSAVQVEPGGAGNFLVMGARLGLQMRALGAVGADGPFGQAVLTALRYEGVDVHRVVRQQDGTTTLVFVLTDEEGGHVFLGRSGEGAKISFGREWEEAILQSDAVQIWGYTFNEARLAEAGLEAARFARAQNRPVFFDPGPFMAEQSQTVWKEILRCSQAVLLTEEEIPAFVGESENGRNAVALLDYGPELVCLKRGAHGCAIFTREGTLEHPGYAVPARDTTAAGDVFAAGFLSAWLKKRPWEEIAAFANALGAAKVQKFGSGRQVPTHEELVAFLEQVQKDLLSLL